MGNLVTSHSSIFADVHDRAVITSMDKHANFAGLISWFVNQLKTAKIRPLRNFPLYSTCDSHSRGAFKLSITAADY